MLCYAESFQQMLIKARIREPDDLIYAWLRYSAHLKHFVTFLLKLHLTPSELQCHLDLVSLHSTRSVTTVW